MMQTSGETNVLGVTARHARGPAPSAQGCHRGCGAGPGALAGLARGKSLLWGLRCQLGVVNFSLTSL